MLEWGDGSLGGKDSETVVCGMREGVETWSPQVSVSDEYSQTDVR